MVRATEAVESAIVGPVNVNHEYSARAMLTPIGSGPVKPGAIQEQRAVRIFTVIAGRPESMEQLEIRAIGPDGKEHSILRQTAVGSHPVEHVTHLNKVTVVAGGAVTAPAGEIVQDGIIIAAGID